MYTPLEVVPLFHPLERQHSVGPQRNAVVEKTLSASLVEAHDWMGPVNRTEASSAPSSSDSVVAAANQHP